MRRVPHSPQRPESDALGLVIERARSSDELDGLRWYVDDTCDSVLWERYFHCGDLGRDLVPVVKAFHASSEAETGVPTGENIVASPPTLQDVETLVPDPFPLKDWIAAHVAELSAGATLKLFENHPDGRSTHARARPPSR